MKTISFVAVLISFSASSSAQSAASVPAEIFSARPVDDATLLLEHLYGKVITYEEPVRVWGEDVEPSPPQRDPNLRWGLIPKSYRLALPPETGTDPDLASILQKIVMASNAQPIGPRFRLLTSKWGYHIVPVQSHDANGSLVATQSLLDFPVFVAKETRTPIRHMQALLAAIKSTSGIFIDLPIFGSPRGFDYAFLGHYGSFEWGASSVSGRDALIDLLEKSVTTAVWSLKCQSSSLPEDRFCSLNIRKITVSVIDPEGKPASRVLRFDRCGDCPSPPQPLPARNR